MIQELLPPEEFISVGWLNNTTLVHGQEIHPGAYLGSSKDIRPCIGQEEVLLLSRVAFQGRASCLIGSQGLGTWSAMLRSSICTDACACAHLTPDGRTADVVVAV
jgi:hypothetical protein